MAFSLPTLTSWTLSGTSRLPVPFISGPLFSGSRDKYSFHPEKRTGKDCWVILRSVKNLANSEFPNSSSIFTFRCVRFPLSHLLIKQKPRQKTKQKACFLVSVNILNLQSLLCHVFFFYIFTFLQFLSNHFLFKPPANVNQHIPNPTLPKTLPRLFWVVPEHNVLIGPWSKIKQVSGADSLFAEHVFEHLTPTQVKHFSNEKHFYVFS